MPCCFVAGAVVFDEVVDVGAVAVKVGAVVVDGVVILCI